MFVKCIFPSSTFFLVVFRIFFFCLAKLNGAELLLLLGNIVHTNNVCLRWCSSANGWVCSACNRLFMAVTRLQVHVLCRGTIWCVRHSIRCRHRSVSLLYFSCTKSLRAIRIVHICLIVVRRWFCDSIFRWIFLLLMASLDLIVVSSLLSSFSHSILAPHSPIAARTHL